MFASLVAPSTQELGPPATSGRITSVHAGFYKRFVLRAEHRFMVLPVQSTLQASMRRIKLTLVVILGILSAHPANADPSPFDLAGPMLRISVSRQGVTLPIGSVPQLSVGDRLKVEAMLPADQSVHYVLVATFLRDPTNPPPDDWFLRSSTWKRVGHGGGPIELTVPNSAQHLVLFLAPENRGDFGTLRSAVQGRPGAFVRAAQDLEQASLDRSRLDAYLAAIRSASARSSDALTHVAPVLANSLHIKIDNDCLSRQPEFQASCLLDAKEALVLGDGVSADSGTLAGAGADLALSLSATPVGGAGYYSPYISAVREIIGIFGAMHTAKYQYIAALGATKGDRMALMLNTPPSFRNPKSVLMVALPAVEPAHLPLLQLTSPTPTPCIDARESFLPVTASPLIYATAYAHNLALRVQLPGGRSVELPLVPDATRGGLAIGMGASLPPALHGPLAANIHGIWGFMPFAGPEVMLQTAGAWQWRTAREHKDGGPLVLTGAPAACIAEIQAAPVHGSAKPATWKTSGAQEITVTLPAMGERPEAITLSIDGPAGTPPATLTIAPPATPPVPVAQILAHSYDSPGSDQAPAATITLTNPDEIPASAHLRFTLKAAGSDRFTGHETVEVATVNGDTTAKLTLGSGLTQVDPQMMVVSLMPSRVLGASAFGPLRVRVVRGGVAGEWLTVGTLVRLPKLKRLDCPADPTAPCTLIGDGLFLMASVSAAPDFEGATSVPEGFPGFKLTVPHPVNGALFVRLHDAPEVVNQMGSSMQS